MQSLFSLNNIYYGKAYSVSVQNGVLLNFTWRLDSGHCLRMRFLRGVGGDFQQLLEIPPHVPGTKLDVSWG